MMFQGILPGSDPTTPNAFIQTPDQIARARLLADALSREGMNYSPVQSPWQGAARLAQALAGAIGNYQADNAQRLATADAAADQSNVLNKNGLYNDPGEAIIPATPGQTTPALAANDAANDAAADAADNGVNPRAALVAALGGGSVPAPAPNAAALARAIGGPEGSNSSPLALAAGLGSGTPYGTANIGGGALGTYGPAIAKMESGGNYGALGPVTSSGDRAYGKYQVMGANIPQWTQAALGRAMTPQEFLASPQAQDAVFNHQFGSYVRQYGPQNAASMWLTGRTLANGGASAADQNGTTGQAYADQFTRNLGSAPASQAISAATGAHVPTWAEVQADNAQGAANIAARTSAQTSPVPTPPPRPADLMPGAPQGTGVSMSAPAPSPADLAQLRTAMMTQAPQPGAGLVGSANAAQPYANSALAAASGLHANIPPAGMDPDLAAQLSGIDRLSPAAAAAPLARPVVPPATTPTPSAADLGKLGAAMTTQPTPSVSATMSGHPAEAPAKLISSADTPQTGIYGQGDIGGLLRVASNPWTSPAGQQVASTLLQNQMPTRPTIIDGPTDPNTGYPTKLVFSPTQGVLGRLNADGSISPAAAGVVQQQGAAGVTVPPGMDAKKYRETLAETAAKNASPTAAAELDFQAKLAERPSYKELAASLPTANALPALAKENTPAGDTALIDGIAKILNPGLAVRQGTYAIFTDEQSGLNRFKGEVDKVLHQGAVLQPDTRAQLMRVANEKMQQYQNAWNTDAAQATKIAKAYNLDPDRVIPQFPALAPLNLTSISTEKTQAYPTTPPAQTPPAPGARLAPDGNWYTPDPARPGKYLMVH